MIGVRDAIVLIALLLSVPISFFRPFYGVLAWNIVGFLNPDRFTFGFANHFPMAQTIAVPTLLGFAVFTTDWKRLFSRDLLLLFVLWLWFTFTTVNNTSMPEFAQFSPDTWYRWQFVTKIILMTAVSIAVVNTWERFRTLLLVVACSFGILVLKTVPFMIVTGGSAKLYGPEGTMLADNNDFGLVMTMTLPIFFFLGKIDPNPKLRILMKCIAAAAVPATLFTYSRGALVGLTVVLFAMLMTLRSRLMLVPIVLCFVAIALLFAPEKWQHRMDFRQEGALIDGSALSRFNAWTYCWNLAMAYPLTGGGFDAFTPTLFDQYAPNPRDVHGPHSIYFGVLAEHGIPGIVLYLTLLGSCFVRIYRIRRHAKKYGDDTAGAYAQMFQFCLLGFMTAGAFLGRAYFDYYFLIVAFTIILQRLCRGDVAELGSSDMPPMSDEMPWRVAEAR